MADTLTQKEERELEQALSRAQAKAKRGKLAFTARGAEKSRKLLKQGILLRRKKK